MFPFRIIGLRGLWRSITMSVSRRSVEPGFILPIVIFALAILGVLVVAGLTSSLDDQRASLSVQEGTRSFYAAEAGLALVRANWASQRYDTMVVAGGSSADLGWTTLPENRSQFHAVIQRLVERGPILLTVDGRSAEPRGGLRTVSVLVIQYPGFTGAVLGDSQVSLTGGAGTDSYNSDSAAYNPATARPNGDVASNGDIVLSGNGTLVRGNAAAGGVVTDPTKVSGTSKNGTRQVGLPGVACPARGYTPTVPSGPGIAYNRTSGHLSVSGGGRNLTLPVPPTSYFFSTLKLSNATLTLDPGAQHVDIYVSDTLAVSGGGVVNSSAKPTGLTVWGCGPRTATWSLSGGSGSYYAVYAPNHPLSITGHADLSGAFIGASVFSSGSGKIHFDEALAPRQEGLSTIVRGSWIEVVR